MNKFPLRRRRRSRSAPPSYSRSLIHEHYRTDPEKRIVLPGLPKHDDDWAREIHDFFNLIFLIPIVVLNTLNWNWDLLLSHPPTIAKAWTGEYYGSFYTLTVAYFLVDLAWILLVPHCVKSPGTIIKHHIATLVYLYVPHSSPQYRWCMGACMSVEVNTWFLIARRVFNKQGFPPWIIKLPPFFSLRVKLISIAFYASWISIRCILYPYLMVLFLVMWVELSREVGTKFNIMAFVVPLHFVFCVLNLRWSYDLLMSKIRFWRRAGKKKGGGGDDGGISKGL